MAEKTPPDLKPVELLVRIQPQATWVGDRLEVQYLASMQPADAPQPERPDPVAPWGHTVSGAEIAEAAEAVRRAGPDERFERLLALIERMTAPRPGGG